MSLIVRPWYAVYGWLFETSEELRDLLPQAISEVLS